KKYIGGSAPTRSVPASPSSDALLHSDIPGRRRTLARPAAPLVDCKIVNERQIQRFRTCRARAQRERTTIAATLILASAQYISDNTRQPGTHSRLFCNNEVDYFPHILRIFRLNSLLTTISSTRYISECIGPINYIARRPR